MEKEEKITYGHEVKRPTAEIEIANPEIRRYIAHIEDALSKAREEARVDELTGLRNRKAFNEDLVAEMGRLPRKIGEKRTSTDRDLLLFFLDVNQLKEVNDRYGHLKGDEVLKLLAQALDETLRTPDIAYRFAGDEFAALLPNADGAAEEIGKRIEAAFTEKISDKEYGSIQGLGVAIGSYLIEHQEPVDRVFALVDDFMYKRKRGEHPASYMPDGE